MTTSISRRVASVTAGGVGVALVTMLGMAPAAVATPVTASATGPGVCPTKGLIKLASTLSNGMVRLGSKGTVDGSTGRACGVLAIKNGKTVAVIQPSNTAFAPVTTKVGLLSFPTTLKSTSVLTGPAAFVGNTLSSQLSGSVLATSTILGQQCAIPLSLHLTTGKSGTVTGSNFRAGKNGGPEVGKLVDGTFAVPAIQPTATCNVVVATLANMMLGLPLAAGQSSISYDATLLLS